MTLIWSSALSLVLEGFAAYLDGMLFVMGVSQNQGNDPHIRTSAHLGDVPATFNERSGGNRIVDHGRYRSFRSICAITVKKVAVEGFVSPR